MKKLLPLLLLLSPLSYAAVSFDATSASTSLELGSSEVISHTTGTGTDGIVVCLVQYEDTGTANISGVTFGGTSMTAVDSRLEFNNNQIQAFYLLDGQFTESGTDLTVTATVSAGDTAGDGGLTVSCLSAFGVNQSVPEIFTNTGASSNYIEDTVTFAESGDILFKASSTSNGVRTATHGAGTWTEIMDLSQAANNDTSQNTARFTVSTNGSQTASTTYTLTNSRLLQTVVRLTTPPTNPDSGTTVAMKQCLGTGIPNYRAANVCGPLGTGDCCPPYLTNPIANATSATTVTGSVSTDRNWGTAYACLSTNSTRTADQIVAGTGCASTDTATVSSNSASFSLTASASTNYYLHFAHPLDRPDKNTAVTNQFTTPSSGGGGPPTEGRNLTGFGTFVCQNDGGNTTEGNGSNSNNGLSMDTALQTIAVADNNRTTGDSIVFCEGGKWTERLVITWSGTAADPAEFLCYFDEGNDNGDPIECTNFAD